jgi:hypothetical protein
MLLDQARNPKREVASSVLKKRCRCRIDKHHLSELATPPAERKLLVSGGIHFNFIAALITERPNGIVSLSFIRVKGLSTMVGSFASTSMYIYG